MKVKLFVNHSLEGVEEQLNGWLATQHISINHITQSQSEKAGRFMFVLSIFYEPVRPAYKSNGCTVVAELEPQHR